MSNATRWSPARGVRCRSRIPNRGCPGTSHHDAPPVPACPSQVRGGIEVAPIWLPIAPLVRRDLRQANGRLAFPPWSSPDRKDRLMQFLRPLFRGMRSLSRNTTQPARIYRPLFESLEDRMVPSAVLLVDDDHAQAPNAQYTSISAAVAAAQPGDTIRVYSGTYHESVTVPKTLTFQAVAKAGPVVVDPGALGSGFNIQANDVRILGFTVQDAIGNPGINLSRTVSGADIEHNVLQDNTFGVYLNSNGTDRTVIRDNRFLHNNPAGAASGNGIYSDQGVTNARIVDNFFTGQQNAAMIFVGNGTATQAQSDLTIRGNTLDHDAPIILVNASNSTISDNLSIASAGSGIFFGGGVHDVVVSHNTLRDGA